MERNITLDYFKIFLSILVVTIHAQPLFYNHTLSGWLISNGIARIAVPCFFVINGFYLHSKINSDTKSMIKWVKRMLIIYVTWMLIYLPILINADLTSTLISLVTGIYHLWYLPALIGGGLLLFAVKKVIKNNNILLALAIALFFIGLYIQDNFFIIAHSGYRTHLYRNMFFMGFPFLFLGYYIQEKKDKLSKFNPFLLLFILLTGLALLLFESEYVSHYNNKKDFLAGIILIAPALFLLLLKYSKYKPNDGYIGLIASGIYYLHMLSMYFVNTIFPLNELKIYSFPLIIFMSSILSVVVIKLNKRLKIFL